MLLHFDGSWEADQQKCQGKRQNARVDPIRKMTEGPFISDDCFEFGG